HIPGTLIGIYKDWNSPDPHDGRNARNNGECRQYDFIAWANTQCRDGKLKRCGSVAHGNAIAPVDAPSELLLQPDHELPLRLLPACINALGEIALLVTVAHRLIDRNHLFFWKRNLVWLPSIAAKRVLS